MPLDRAPQRPRGQEESDRRPRGQRGDGARDYARGEALREHEVLFAIVEFRKHLEQRRHAGVGRQVHMPDEGGFLHADEPGESGLGVQIGATLAVQQGAFLQRVDHGGDPADALVLVRDPAGDRQAIRN